MTYGNCVSCMEFDGEPAGGWKSTMYRPTQALKACSYCGTLCDVNKKCESCGAPAAVVQPKTRRWYQR